MALSSSFTEVLLQSEWRSSALLVFAGSLVLDNRWKLGVLHPTLTANAAQLQLEAGTSLCTAVLPVLARVVSGTVCATNTEVCGK